MSESRLVPSNLMAWPRIRDLLPDQKLIIYHLWATMPAACGCALIDLGGFQGALNITQAALSDALKDFEKRGLLKLDEETGEVFVIDWFRFHKFVSPSRIRLLNDSVNRIQSASLNLIVKNSMSCVLREGKLRKGKEIFLGSDPPRAGNTATTKNINSLENQEKPDCMHGILIENNRDVDCIAGLINKFGKVEVERAALEVLPANGKKYPYQSEVYKLLKLKFSQIKGNSNGASQSNSIGYAVEFYGISGAC